MVAGSIPELIVGSLKLSREIDTYKATICFCYASLDIQALEIIQFLHPTELIYFSGLEFERRIKSYLIGRYAAKGAVSDFIGAVHFNNILIDRGIFYQPIVVYPHKTNIQVGITHCDNIGVAIAYSEFISMGIDIEKVSMDRRSGLELLLNKKEVERLDETDLPHDTKLTLLWTAKESLSKCLKTGLIAMQILEIDTYEIKIDEHEFVIIDYKYFPQYHTYSFFIEDYICSITLPREIEIKLSPVWEFLHTINQMFIGGNK